MAIINLHVCQAQPKNPARFQFYCRVEFAQKICPEIEAKQLKFWDSREMVAGGEKTSSRVEFSCRKFSKTPQRLTVQVTKHFMTFLFSLRLLKLSCLIRK